MHETNTPRYRLRQYHLFRISHFSKGQTTQPILRTGAFTEEVEDNGSFAKPQVLRLPTIVRGRIGAALDVDVFAFEGKAGQHVTVEILTSADDSPGDAAGKPSTLLWAASTPGSTRPPSSVLLDCRWGSGEA